MLLLAAMTASSDHVHDTLLGHALQQKRSCGVHDITQAI